MNYICCDKFSTSGWIEKSRFFGSLAYKKITPLLTTSVGLRDWKSANASWEPPRFSNFLRLRAPNPTIFEFLSSVTETIIWNTKSKMYLRTCAPSDISQSDQDLQQAILDSQVINVLSCSLCNRYISGIMCKIYLSWYYTNKYYSLQTSSPEVIKLFSCSTQLSMKFVPLINLKSLKVANSFMLSSAEYEISLLINMKMPTIVGIFIFISREKSMLSWVE